MLGVLQSPHHGVDSISSKVRQVHLSPDEKAVVLVKAQGRPQLAVPLARLQIRQVLLGLLAVLVVVVRPLLPLFGDDVEPLPSQFEIDALGGRPGRGEQVEDAARGPRLGGSRAAAVIEHGRGVELVREVKLRERAGVGRRVGVAIAARLGRGLCPEHDDCQNCGEEKPEQKVCHGPEPPLVGGAMLTLLVRQ